MKHSLFLLVCLFGFNIINAQESENYRPLVLGGSLHFGTQQNESFTSSIGFSFGSLGIFNNSSQDDPKGTSFYIRPYVGVQLSERFLAGLLLDLSLSRYSSTLTLTFPEPVPVDFERKSNQYGIGLFTRHSFIPDGRFDFFIQPYAQYFILSEDEFRNDNLSTEEIANYFAIGTELGVLYNISDRWRATLRMGSLRYINGNWERKDTNLGEDFSAFGLNLSLSSVQFGVEMLL